MYSSRVPGHDILFLVSESLQTVLYNNKLIHVTRPQIAQSIYKDNHQIKLSFDLCCHLFDKFTITLLLFT